ncbi:hypothetical protein [Halorubrum cibi]|uniref:Uncharacterized protein n=1 Tax=Halorubrum cibi TaxID=413815 RepID=A0A521F5F3_9EURY|nr:hypothetical protein [Halorubrum cibi]SMO91384.1 hypothetical protein SAMN06264867_12010 [Halorubrum cibi]
MSRLHAGIVVGEAFADYLEKFRTNHPIDEELAVEHGCFQKFMTRTESGSYGGVV